MVAFMANFMSVGTGFYLMNAFMEPLILQIAGYLIAGQSFDHTGSYRLAYTMFLVFDVIAAILIWSIPKSKVD